MASLDHAGEEGGGVVGMARGMACAVLGMMSSAERVRRWGRFMAVGGQWRDGARLKRSCDETRGRGCAKASGGRGCYVGGWKSGI
jgi:hypothetical protein